MDHSWAPLDPHSTEFERWGTWACILQYVIFVNIVDNVLSMCGSWPYPNSKASMRKEMTFQMNSTLTYKFQPCKVLYFTATESKQTQEIIFSECSQMFFQVVRRVVELLTWLHFGDLIPHRITCEDSKSRLICVVRKGHYNWAVWCNLTSYSIRNKLYRNTMNTYKNMKCAIWEMALRCLKRRSEEGTNIHLVLDNEFIMYFQR